MGALPRSTASWRRRRGTWGRGSGASSPTYWFPTCVRGLLAGALLAFTLSLRDDFVITFFTSGPDTTTFPVKVYSMVRFSVTPEVNAASTILIVLNTIALTAVALRLQGTDVAKAETGGL